MDKPLVCFISYNRLGMTANNLEQLLKTENEFELIIVDNASSDGTWEYIESVKNDRIIEKHRFENNYGVIYAINYGLSKRRENQPFIAIENDMYIEDINWLNKFKQTVSVFPELGMVGAVALSYLDKKVINHSEEKVEQLLSKKEENKMNMIFIPEEKNGVNIYYRPDILGGCLYLTPEVLKLIGYWNEETCGGDAEIGKRINLFTPYYTAMTTLFYVEYRNVKCESCIAKNYCKVDTSNGENCISAYKKLKSHSDYSRDLKPKIDKLLLDIKLENRTVFSASIHDSESMINYSYDLKDAKTNFIFFKNYGK